MLRRTTARRFRLVALLLAATAGALVLFGGRGTGYEVRAVMQDAGQLVKGNLVKVGGVKIGRVIAIDLGDRNQAEVTLAIDDPAFAPLHRGTTATIRSTSLSAVAGRLVALAPGPNNAPEIPDSGAIGFEDTQSIVDLDQVLNTFDAQTRSALQGVVHDSAAIYSSNTAAANRGLEALNPALSRTAALTTELLRDRRTFERVLVDSASVLAAVGSRERDLERGLVHGATTAGAVADATGALDATLRRSPAVLRRANTTLVNLRAALGDLRPALRDARPAAPRLARVVRQLAPLTRATRPVVAQVLALLPDATTVLRGLPRLDAIARPAFAATVDALTGAAPVVAAARPYTPDVVAGLLNGFGGTTGASYDANGHYVRISLQGNNVSVQNAGSLLPVPAQGSGGTLDGYRSGLAARCPGAATQAAPDRSNPFTPPEAPCRAEDSPR